MLYREQEEPIYRSCDFIRSTKFEFMQSTKGTISPTAFSDRILSLDVLRGIAVLGILIMNIQSFSMIGAAYINPMAFGDLTGINKWVWIVSHLVASEKFMSIFSILFGAGILLFSEKAVAKGLKASVLHYRRMLWLLAFGMIHAYLIWYGDILVAYSLCGMLVYLFKKLSPKKLIIWAVVFFVVPILLNLFFGMTIQYWPEESYNRNLESWLPSVEETSREISAMRGSWLEQMEIRVESSIFMQTFLFCWNTFWRVTSMMLLGMALYKWGVLTAHKSGRFYIWLSLTGLITGFTIIAIGVSENFRVGWKMDFSMFTGMIYNYIGSIAVALGYISLVMLICKHSLWPGVTNTFSSIGKMAFSNYITMSLLAMFIFYGCGLGLFGQVDRKFQILIAVAIWIIIIITSRFWLRKFQYGPLEWLWRRMTYLSLQPFVRK